MFKILRTPTDGNLAGHYSYNMEYKTKEQAQQYLKLLFDTFKMSHSVKWDSPEQLAFTNKNNNTRTYIQAITGADDFETLTAKNIYNYSVKQLIINHTARTFEIIHGGSCRISKKNSTKKTINEKILQLQKTGYICTNGGEYGTI